MGSSKWTSGVEAQLLQHAGLELRLAGRRGEAEGRAGRGVLLGVLHVLDGLGEAFRGGGQLFERDACGREPSVQHGGDVVFGPVFGLPAFDAQPPVEIVVAAALVDGLDRVQPGGQHADERRVVGLRDGALHPVRHGEHVVGHGRERVGEHVGHDDEVQVLDRLEDELGVGELGEHARAAGDHGAQGVGVAADALAPHQGAVRLVRPVRVHLAAEALLLVFAEHLPAWVPQNAEALAADLLGAYGVGQKVVPGSSQ